MTRLVPRCTLTSIFVACIGGSTACDSAVDTPTGQAPGGAGGAPTATSGSGGAAGVGGAALGGGGAGGSAPGTGGTSGATGGSGSATAGTAGAGAEPGAETGGMAGAADGGVAGVSGGPSGAGTSGGGSAGSGGTAGPFTLAWQDDFDTIDGTRWALQTFSWDGNLAQFSTANASVADGILSIALTAEPSDTSKPFRGVELRSVPTLTYGKVETRMRFASGSGVVSSLVLIYTPWPADDWNEIDIEHLGNSPESSQLNCRVYTGPPTNPPVTTSVSPTQDPEIKQLGFDAEADFHVYTIEWTPADVRFGVDGTLLRVWTTEIARMKLPQNILFTIWASNVASWAGPIDGTTAPTTADVDWVKVYSFDG